METRSSSADDDVLRAVTAGSSVISVSAVEIRAPLSATISEKTVPTLPAEIVVLILDLVNRETRRICTRVNRTWATVARPELWKCGKLAGFEALSKFWDLIQFQQRTREAGDLAVVSLPKITSFVTEIILELEPSTIDLGCKVLAHLERSLTTLSLSAQGAFEKGHLCQILNVCPRSVENLRISWFASGGIQQGDRKDGGNTDFEKLQHLFRQFVDIRWFFPDPDLILASVHDRLRVFQFSLAFGRSLPREHLTRLIRCLPPTLVGFGAELGGEELVLLGKMCSNLKALECRNTDFIRSEHLEEVLSTVGPGLVFLAANVFCSEDLRVIAQHCRSIKHLQVKFRGRLLGRLGIGVPAGLPELTPRHFEDLLRAVGPTISTFSVDIFTPMPITKRLVSAIADSCPHITKVFICVFDDPSLDEGKVGKLFEKCKELLLVRHLDFREMEYDLECGKEWTRAPGASFADAFLEFDDCVG
ncbi:hypothetical protein HK102_010993 [Quaeritorhiza haematococci]|nr:hypothetical protein HK102_010993 [Quaeritorhiza haematococci]